MIVLYLAAIVAANLSVAHFGPEAAIYNAFLFIGLTLVTRDRLHDSFGKHRFLKMLGLILAGAALTYAINPAGSKIAIASAAAFLAAELVDYLIYHVFEDRDWLTRSNASNIPSAMVDSIVFPTIAFGAFSATITFSMFAAKVAGGVLFSLLLVRRARRGAVSA